MNNEYEFYAEDVEESFEFYEDFGNRQLNNRLVEACGLKNVLPMKVQEGINEGTFGMTATQLKKARGLKEPFNDNLTEDEVDIKNIGIIIATNRIRNHELETIPHKLGRKIGVDSGELARKTIRSI